MNRTRRAKHSTRNPRGIVATACAEALESRQLLTALTIAQENALPGTPQSVWDISGGGAGDTSIQGFATDISVNQGQTVNFKIDDKNVAPYHLDIYRMGYYGGLGARKVATITNAQTLDVAQPAPLSDPNTGLVDAGNWSVTASWQVPADATSGIYFAKVIRDDTGGASHIVFVVRNDAGHSDLLFQTSDTTWQAYNNYGGNSLYTGNSVVAPGRAVKVSYNRPFNTRALPAGAGNSSWVFYTEYPMVRFLERNGYDVSYFTGLDSDRNGALIKNHKTFMSVGHDEYWSAGQRTAVEQARDAGVNLAFFSGNESYWKTRWETSIDGSGQAYRTLVTYKESKAQAKIDPAPVWTGAWRDPIVSPPYDGGRPENALSGTAYTVDRGADNVGTPITVSSDYSSLRFWRNTSVATLDPGQTATLGDSVLGYEWDEDLDNGFRPAGLFDLSTTTQNVTQKLQNNTGATAPGVATHALTYYRAASGAHVFSAGTVQWAWGLDAAHDGRATAPDVNLQQATVNVLADLGAQPATLQSGLLAATASTDTTGPTSAISTPAAGATVHTGGIVQVTGTASDTGGGAVAAVEVSTDGGLTWHRATGRNAWTYAWTPSTAGTTVLLSRAVDDSGNIQSTTASRSVKVIGPISFWGNNTTPATPAQNDSGAVELGMKFTSDVAGYITSIRFYKGTGNTGTHVGHLWTATGTLLGSATFANETATGWQQVDFPSPIAINPGTTYVISYFAPAGHYAISGGYFNTTGVDSGTLHAPSSGASGGNGVYVYGSSGGFPTNSFNATNYWVDPVFDVAPIDTLPPTVSVVSPANGSTGAATNAPVTVTFSESMDASTISTSTIQLTGPGGVLVPASVTYNVATHVATLMPTSPLSDAALYTLRVHGGTTAPTVRDDAGNAMATDFTASFTTAAALGAGPFSLWDDTAVPLVPAQNDSSAVELGVKFRSDAAGFITGLRFYKGTGNTGTHVGHLWSSSGQLLASGTFGNETATGWQTLTFTSPVAIDANTTYVASYYAPAGHYAISGSFFNAGLDSGPLHVPSSSASGGNGVYAYGTGGGFPTNSFNATNYWVDVVFNTSVTDNTAPTVVAKSPAAGATGIPTPGNVTATFSERVQASSISFVLTGPGGAVVPATVTYDDASRTVTLDPTADLTGLTTYTATFSGVKDLAGNLLAAPVTWSFTTGIVTHTWTQTSAADFTAGTQGGTVVGTGGDVRLQAATTFNDDFTGTALGSGWASTSWAPFGGGPTSVTVSGGILSVGGAGVFSTASATGATVEGRVSFGAAPFQHFGLATDFTDAPGNYWAVFSTGGTTNTLFARVNVNGATQEVNLGALPAGFHVYDVVPVSGGFQFLVDGALQTTINAVIPASAPLKIGMSAFNGASPMTVDYARLSSYPATGTFTSSVFDAGAVANWLTASWNSTLPAGTSLVVETRSGSTATPDGSWSAWTAVSTSGGSISSPASRYFQYRVRLSTTDPTQTPVFLDFTLTWS
jgi:methionine-rich copper-binding protein CopC